MYIWAGQKFFVPILIKPEGDNIMNIYSVAIDGPAGSGKSTVARLLAKELKVPVITCAQLSRGPESRTDKTPMLSDLRDSGAIEQDADVVMFLYRDDYYKDDPDKPNTASVIIAKNRHGSTGKVEMGWLGQYTKFTTIDTEHE